MSSNNEDDEVDEFWDDTDDSIFGEHEEDWEAEDDGEFIFFSSESEEEEEEEDLPVVAHADLQIVLQDEAGNPVDGEAYIALGDDKQWTYEGRTTFEDLEVGEDYELGVIKPPSGYDTVGPLTYTVESTGFSQYDLNLSSAVSGGSEPYVSGPSSQASDSDSTTVIGGDDSEEDSTEAESPDDADDVDDEESGDTAEGLSDSEIRDALAAVQFDEELVQSASLDPSGSGEVTFYEEKRNMAADIAEEYRSNAERNLQLTFADASIQFGAGRLNPDGTLTVPFEVDL